MKTLDRRIKRLEAKHLKHLETEPVSDNTHPGALMSMKRLLGECPRYNRAKQLRAERLADGNIDYCRRMLERLDRQDARELTRLESRDEIGKGSDRTIYDVIRRMSRQPIVERLGELHGMDMNAAEQIVDRSVCSGGEELAVEILSLFAEAGPPLCH